jgi:methylated-DNA-[protein]-cysteine S-methyltransferase
VLTVMTMASPIGPLTLYASIDELVGLSLPDRPAPDSGEPLVEREKPRAERGESRAGRGESRAGRSEVLARAADQLAEYFAGKRRVFDLPLGPRGTGFQARVWRELTKIPYGETCSYGDIARAVGRPSASRAVGAANGRNPIAIIVPCHRVIGASGELTGYGGGLPMKRWLLAHERQHTGSRQAQLDFSARG